VAGGKWHETICRANQSVDGANAAAMPVKMVLTLMMLIVAFV
jgi:hypothetical protein